MCISGGEREDCPENGKGVDAPLVDAGGVISESLGLVEGGEVYLEVEVGVEVGVGVENVEPDMPSITGFVWAEPYTEKYTSSGLGWPWVDMTGLFEMTRMLVVLMSF